MNASNTKIRCLRTPRRPVVLLGCFRHSGIGILRSLGRLGIPVSVIDHDRFSVGFSSRYCRGRYIWDLARARRRPNFRSRDTMFFSASTPPAFRSC